MYIQKNSLIASCQAVKGEPLFGLNMMHHFARACVLGGANGIRCNYVDDINSIKKEVNCPTIGIIKAVYSDSLVVITPTLKEVKELLEKTETEIIALDCTFRKRPNDEKIETLVEYIRNFEGRKVEIMADCSTYEEAEFADKLHFDYIGTTLRGYTEYTKGICIPDYQLLEKMSKTLTAKVIAEGGIWDNSQLRRVLDTDVYAVVIGSAITRPMDITKHFKEEFDK